MKTNIPSASKDCWYAAKTKGISGRKIREILDNLNVESFMPMYEAETERYGMKVKIFKPLVLNLIFIHADYTTAQALIQEHELPLTYMDDPHSDGLLTVPDKRIQDLRLVMSQTNDFLHLSNDTVRRGDLVKVNEGEFTGIEGELVRIKGHKRVVIRLEGLFSLATTYIPGSYLEKIEE